MHYCSSVLLLVHTTLLLVRTTLLLHYCCTACFATWRSSVLAVMGLLLRGGYTPLGGFKAGAAAAEGGIPPPCDFPVFSLIFKTTPGDMFAPKSCCLRQRRFFLRPNRVCLRNNRVICAQI